MQYIPTVAKSVVDTFYCTKLKPAYWTLEELQIKHGHRSAQQIVADGDFHFLSSCPDLTWVTLDLLKRQGIESRLVVDKHLEENPDQPRKIHFVPEYLDPMSGTWVSIDYEMPGGILIQNGGHTQSRYFKQEALGRVPSSDLDFGVSIFENLKSFSRTYTSLGPIGEILQTYDLEKHLRIIFSRATLESFETWMLRYKKSPKIEVLGF